jgi:uncharacterized protein (TIGR03437 family)
MILVLAAGLFSSYLGGTAPDVVRRVAVAGDGSVWVAGLTSSDDFPKVNPLPMPGPTPHNCSVGGGLFPAVYPCPIPAGFLARYDAAGTRLLWSTWYDPIYDMKVGPSGDIYIAGSTAAGAGFIARLRPDGTQVFRTAPDVAPVAIALDSAGNIYAAGMANNHVVVTKYDASGATVLYLKTLGGSGTERPVAIGIDSSGDAVVAGVTNSTDFPTTPGVLEPAHPAAQGDVGFVAKLGPNGTSVVYSTYFSASTVNAIAVTAAGETWVAGGTGTKFLLSRLDSAGSHVAVAITENGSAEAVALDSGENVYVAGNTTSAQFPTTTNAWQRNIRGTAGCAPDYFQNDLCTPHDDAFLAEYSPAGARLYATFLGGSDHDSAEAVAINAAGQVIVGGWTRSDDLPLEQATANDRFTAATCKSISLGPNGPRDYHTTYWPCEDAFVAVIDLSAPALQFTNGASFGADVVTPGTLISLFGSGLGPENGVSFHLTPEGNVPTIVAGTRVLFDGVPAPVLYAQSKQVNAVVPFSMAGRAKVHVAVEYNGSTISAGDWRTGASAPGLFTLNSSGAGPIAALNEDGTINGMDNPAKLGSIVQLFATGAGLGDPEQVDGQPAAAPLSKPRADVSVLFERPAVTSGIRFTGGYLSGEITYAGAAPTLVAGVLQVNVRIPTDAETGPAVPLLLTVGTLTSPIGTTISVKE